METKELSNVNVDALFERISALIEGARKTVATAVSVAEVYTKYEIGRYIVADEQNGKYRATSDFRNAVAEIQITHSECT